MLDRLFGEKRARAALLLPVGFLYWRWGIPLAEGLASSLISGFPGDGWQRWVFHLLVFAPGLRLCTRVPQAYLESERRGLQRMERSLSPEELRAVTEAQRPKVEEEPNVITLTEDDVSQLVADTKVYQWEVRRRAGLKWWAPLAPSLGAVLAPALGFAVFFGVERLSPTLALILAAAGVLLGVLYFALFGLLLLALLVAKVMSKPGQSVPDLDPKTIMVPVHLTSLVALGYTMMGEASPLRTAFTGPTGEKAQWALLLIETVSRAVLLDAPEIFDAHLSTIAPANGYARLALWLFNLSVVAIVAEGIVFGFKIFRVQRRVFYATGDEAFDWLANNVLLIAVLECDVFRVATVSPTESVLKISAEDFRVGRRRVMRQGRAKRGPRKVGRRLDQAPPGA